MHKFPKPPVIFFSMSKKNRDFRQCPVSNRTESFFAMNNSKLFVSAICVLGLTLAAPLSTEAGRGHGGGGGGHSAPMARGGGFARGGYAPGGYARGGYAAYARGGYTRGAYARGAYARGGYARAGMGPYSVRRGGNFTRASASNRTRNGGNRSGRNWNGGNWSGRHNWNSSSGHWRNSNGKWGWWNGNRWCYPRTNVVFIGDFGFPWWWGWGWGPWAGYGWGYPYGYGGYGYYGYDDPYYGGGGYPYYGYGNNGYGNGYGAEYQSQYGGSSQSRVAELQQRLSRAGYYHGSVDGVLGPQTRRAIRAYQQEHGDVG